MPRYLALARSLAGLVLDSGLISGPNVNLYRAMLGDLSNSLAINEEQRSGQFYASSLICVFGARCSH
jgi:hypothetical protein